MCPSSNGGKRVPPPPRARGGINAPAARTIQGPNDQLSRKQMKELAVHHPIYIGEIGPISFQRCKCGFTLAMYKGDLYWLRAHPITGPASTEDLARASRAYCHMAFFEMNKKKKHKQLALTNS